MRLIMGSHSAVALADPATGDIIARTELVNPSFVAASPAGDMLYVVSEDVTGPGAVHTLRIEADKILAHGPARPSGGEQPCHVSIHPSGRFLLVSNYGDGALAVLPIAADGTLEDPACVVRHKGSGPDLPRQDGPHVHQAQTDPSGQWIVACDLGTDEAVVYRLEPSNGQLSRHSAARFAPGQGIRHLVFSPDRVHAFVACELSSELVKCEWDARDGVLTPMQQISTVSMDNELVDRNYPAAVVISADGQRVYVTNRGHDSIAVVDAEVFELIGTRSCEGEWPRDACLSRDGSTLFVANEHSGTVVPFDVRNRVPEPEHGKVIDFAEATSVCEG